MARVLILIGGHLWTSPRSQKEASTWAGLGHDVTIAGIWFDAKGAERDREMAAGELWRFVPILDFRRRRLGGRLNNLSVRIRARVARELYTKFGVYLPAIHGYGAASMLRAAIRHDADFTIVHSEAGLWAGERLLARGKTVGVDFEDWFSEDILSEARACKPLSVVRRLEKHHAESCPYTLTTSHVMSDAIAQAYGVKPPTVVYNTFSIAEHGNVEAGAKADTNRRDRNDLAVPSLHWFSQNIGPGRGLEILFEALDRIDVPFECHLRGALTTASEGWVRKHAGSAGKKLIFHDIVPSSELPLRIAEHDIGLALETRATRSRDLTVTNKIFQYLQAGLAVVATDTLGQREIFASTPGIGIMVKDGDSNELARALHVLLTDPAALARTKAAAVSAFHEKWSWERQRSALTGQIRSLTV